MGQRNHTVRRHLTRYALRWWPVYASCDEVPWALSVKCQAPE
ncbi:hypothetical protein ECDEC6C_4686 [Escherichia coli DEC6C]|nr:hypothetical protein ECSTECB2F1_4336 [Escherichia coli O91:H21 str. B2F1]EHV55055.1 hypothetical protein ECDEC6C_4686 [Escherichia coli DEC6C]